ncbi:E3 ubiquitin-protein ligase RNF13 [Anopheles nili]|uniref:E3 ubiquitin-protein ligase RNF13 n=1 Tax=Anopheles nili TaxID=185578 RepID=UPI00237A7A01|nr:E3 ubiquitin-protein ligase RNF13 [Anopheles nili]
MASPIVMPGVAGTLDGRKNYRQSKHCYHHMVPLIVTTILLVMRPLPIAEADILVYQMLNDQIVEEFRDLPATFGGEIPDSGLKVLADRADPPDGCTEMRLAPAPNGTSKFAVVIARYNCSFEVKVRNAQQAGYSMVIVHNVGSNDLEHMSANHPQDLLIPSVFVGEMAGRSIIEAYLYDRGYALVITDDIPFNISNNLIIPFAIVVGLCFIIMVLFMIIRCIRERRRMMRHRLPARILKKIVIVKFAKGMRFDMCAICLDDYVENDRLRVLPCRHAYHAICIDPWLTKNRRVCPICKRKVIVSSEHRRQRRYSSDSSLSTDESTPLLNSTQNAATAANVVSPREEQQTQQQATEPPENHIVDVPPSDDDDEMLDDRNIPSPRWLLRYRSGQEQPQQQQEQEVQEQQQQQTQQPTNALPFIPFDFLKRMLTNSWSQEARTGNDPESVPPPPPPSSSSPGNVVTPAATPGGGGNNILNAHLSGSFHGSEDTTDDELLDAMQRDRTKQRQFRSAPDMPSTSVGARLGVAALPNVNFNPATGAASGTSNATADSSGSSSRQPQRQGRRNRWRKRGANGNGNDSHIV